jgi:RHS repeat-associated protein
VGRHARRLAVFLVLALVATMGIPSGLKGSWPLGWLDFRLSFADAASASVGVPVQQLGAEPGGHYDGKQAGFIQPKAVKRDPWTAPTTADEDSFDPETSKKVTGESNPSMDVYQNTDGSQTATVSTGRVNYQGADGKWRPIDTTLTRGSDGRLKTAANSFGVSLAAPAAPAAAGLRTQAVPQTKALNEDLARVTLPTGEVFAYRLQGAAAVTPAVNGDQSTYAEILPGVDLQLRTLTSSVKETIVLKNPAAAREFVFPLRLDGLTAQLTAAGELEVRNADNEIALIVPRPFMEDSSPVDGQGDRVRSYAVAYSLIEVDGKPALKVTADDAWLDDPKRVWPVEVDPTVYTANTLNEGDAFVDNESDTGPDVQNGNSLAVGRYQGNIARSFVKFTNFDADGFVGKRITGAKLWVYLTWATTCDSYRDISVHKVTAPWTVADVAASGLSGGPAYTAPIGKLKITDHYPGCTNTALNRSIGKWHAVTLDSTTLHDWATNRGSANWNQGLAITGDETVTDSWKRFTAGNYSDNYKPYLEITYAKNIAPQVNTLFPSSGTQAATLTPQLIADGYDPDGFPATLEYNFEIFEEAANGTQTKISQSGWRTDKTWTVPAGVLKWGGRYRWQATLNDGRNNEGVPSYTWQPSWRYVLTTPVPQAPLTASLEQHGDAGFAPGSGTYTTSAVDAQLNSVGPSLEMARTYNSADTRTAGGFGAGWSSLLDAKVTERKDENGVFTIAEVTYPTGQTVAYGRNADGTFSVGLGRYARFTTVTGGYQLTDKSGVAYLFTAATGASGVYGLTSITDGNGRKLTLTWTSGKVTQLRSDAAQRNLYVTWSGSRVATVYTDPAVAGDADSVATWTYTYTGDQLTKVCPPTSATKCTTYSYTDANQYPSTVENLDPYSYWRLSDPAGSTQASSAAIERMKADAGTHSNVTLGTAGSGALTGSAATGATYNGTTARTSLPAKTVTQAGHQTVSMWFKTSAAGDHVLYSQSWDPITSASTTQPYQPVLYVGTDGKLYGGFPTVPAANSTLGTLVGAKSGRCLNASGGGVANNGPVVLYDCAGVGNDTWTLTSGGQLRFTHNSTTRCMRAAGTEAGSRVLVYDCLATATDQRWRLTGDGRLVNVDSGMCMTPYGGGTTNSTVLTVWPCDRPYAADQTWSWRNHTPIASGVTVNDGKWHHVVLSAAGNKQTLYVDDAAKVTQNAPITDIQPRYQYLGAGFLGGNWTAQDNGVTGKNNGSPDFYTGAISDAAVYDRPLTDDRVAELYAARSPRKLLSQVTRPSGAITAKVEYDPVSAKVRKVTDGNNGTWTLADPEIKGTSQVYASAVLGTNPVDYWRLNDLPGTTEPYNEVNGNTATYSGTVIGGTPGTDGPFKDTTAPYFDGTAGKDIAADGSSIDTTQSFTASAWVNAADLTANRAAVSVVGNQATAFTLSYDKGTNRWVATMCAGDVAASACPRVTSTTVPAANTWTHLAATFDAPTKTVRLFVNGNLEKTTPLTSTLWAGNTLVVGRCKYNASDTCDLWKGRIAEVATYQRKLSDQDILAQFRSADRTATGVAMPAKSVTLTGPTAKTSSQLFNLYTGQQIAAVDTLGNITQFGYDPASGATTLQVDPNGNKVERKHDARGNVIEQTTWQDQTDATTKSTTRYLYFPDATTANPAPDPRNDKVLTVQDGRTDGTYKTTFEYDSRGNSTTVTDALGRVTTTVLTDGTTGVPAGLATKQITPGGAVVTTKFAANGDIEEIIDPAGKITRLTYDKLGRVLTRTEITKTSGPDGLTTRFTYDKAGRLLTLTQPGVLNRVTSAVHTPVSTYTYNDDGQPTSISVADTTGGDTTRTASSTYNTLGQLVSETEPDGTATTYTYDLFGEVVTATDEADTTVATEYDSEGQILSVRFKDYTGDPDDPQTPADVITERRTYDPAGRLIRTTDSMNWSTEYTYTHNNLLKTATRVDGTKRFVLEDNTYDLAGNLTKQVTNDGRTTTAYTLDAAARPYQVAIDPNGLNRKVTNTLSPDDLLLATTLRNNQDTVLAHTESIYDPTGNDLVNTTYSGTTNAPVARWKLNDTTGTGATDSAGNAPAETTTGVTGPWSADAPANRPGLTGSAKLSPGDTGKHLTTATAVVDATRSYTVSAWVKLTNPTGDHTAVSQDSGTSSGIRLGYHGSSQSWRMAACETGAAACAEARSTQTAAVDEWTHLTGVYDAATKQVKLYVNGNLQATATWCCAPKTTNGPFVIGAGKQDGQTAGTWLGNIADVQVYQRALTATDAGDVHAGTYTAAGSRVIRESYQRDTDGTITASLAADGALTSYEYDQAGQLALTVGPPTTPETYGGQTPVPTRSLHWTGYNTFGEPTEERDPTGLQVTTRYDANGRPIKTIYPSYTVPGSTTTLTPETSAEYDNVGQLTRTVDARGNATALTYDMLGRVTKVTSPDNGIARYAYDTVGDVLAVTDPTGARQTATYDYLGRQETATEVVRQTGSGHRTDYEYGPGGWLAKVTSPDGVKASYTYNAVGEAITATDPALAVTNYQYNGAGQLIRTTLPDNTYSSTTYDLAGRAVATRDYNAANTLLRTTGVTYDKAGNVATSTDARGAVTKFAYDATGLLTTQVEPVSATESITTSFGYDAAGRPTRFTDGRTNDFWNTYNSWGLTQSRIEPATTAHPAEDDRKFTTIYDIGGLPVKEIQPGGVELVHTYDEMGQLTRSSGTGAETATQDRTYSYDLAGRVTSLSGPGGTNALAWDDRGLLTSVTGPSGNSSFTYTADGNPKTRTDAAGTTTYGYDNAGRLSTIVNPTTGIQQTLGYNQLSNVDKVTYGANGNTRHLGYDSLQRLTTDELKSSTDASIAKIAYGYDDNSNLTSKTTTGFTGSAANTYTYDLANRLTSWNNGNTNTLYEYDKSGNRTRAGEKIFTYDNRNRLLTSTGSGGYEYTARGTLRRTFSGTVGLETVADAFGQVIRQQADDLTYTDYTYDGLGRVIKDGFAYTGLGNDLATDGTALYTRDPGGGLLGIKQGSTSVNAWTDRHTDLVAQFTNSGTTLTGSTTYDPLGNVTATAGAVGNLGFQQEYTEQATGRVNMHARWYNPETGQFDTRDTANLSPVGQSANANRYGYGNGDPISNIDPTGHSFMTMKGCSSVFGCMIQGFVNSFDVIEMGKSLWRAASNIEASVRNFYNGLKGEAAYWGDKIRTFIHDGVNCDSKHIFLRPACAFAATEVGKYGGWACAISDLCQTALDCSNLRQRSSMLACAEAAGEILASALLALLSLGSTAIIQKVAKRVTNLLDRYGLPDRRKSSNGGSGAGNINRDGNEEKWDTKPKPGKEKENTNKGKNGKKPKNKGKNNSGSGGKDNGNKKPKNTGTPKSKGPKSTGPKPSAPRPVSDAQPDPRRNLPTANDRDGSGPGHVARQDYGTEIDGCHSFDPDTLVLMADGSTKKIADVELGDEVVATDPENGDTTAEKVVVLHNNLDTELTDITVSAEKPETASKKSGQGKGDRSTRGPTEETVLETTQNHPFWDATTGEWVNAGDLQPGKSTLTGPDGTVQYVTAVRNHTGAKTMRDLTVDNIHTYYVIAGLTPVLVHNNSACLSRKPTLSISNDGEATILGDRTDQPWINQQAGNAFRNDLAALFREFGYDVLSEADDDHGALVFNVAGFYGPRRFDIGLWDKDGNHIAYIEAKWGAKRYGIGTEQADKDQALLKAHPWMNIQVIQSHLDNGELDMEIFEQMRRRI